MFCSGTNNGNHIDHRPCAVECAWNSFSSGFVTGDYAWKNNKEIYNNELFEFINKNEIDIVFVFGRTVYNNLPSCSKNKTAAEKQPDLDNGNLFVGKKRDFIRHCVYLKGEQHKNAKTMLKRDVHVYGLRHPSARCGFNAENYKPYLKNLI